MQKRPACYTKLQMKLFGITSFSALKRNLHVYRRDIADLGFLKICDLFSTKENLNPEQGFFIMGLINSMPASWRLTIKRQLLHR